MKVHVACQVVYGFDVDVPQEIADNPEDLDIAGYCDEKDPVYPLLCDSFVRRNIDWDAALLSIVNDETGERIWEF